MLVTIEGRRKAMQVSLLTLRPFLDDYVVVPRIFAIHIRNAVEKHEIHYLYLEHVQLLKVGAFSRLKWAQFQS